MPEFRFALRSTLPVLAGYLTLGFGFGLLMHKAGYAWWFSALMSLLVFAGAAQYLAVGLLSQGTGWAAAAGLTLLVNARHLVYGVSVMDKYRTARRALPYLIFGLTDETWALNASLEIPTQYNHPRVYFYITLLDHAWWVLGTLAGAVGGALIPFPLDGIEFALTSLFTVLLVEQLRKPGHRIPALVGAMASVGSLMVFGPSGMLLPAIGVTLAGLAALNLRRSRAPAR